ncbi:hypothetical protein EST52_25520, partial [Escherichia coli]|nr:hypothetical protein [Escherichia coli]
MRFFLFKWEVLLPMYGKCDDIGMTFKDMSSSISLMHQGNGTAHIFEGHPDIITFSIHGEKNFPFKKEKSHIDIGLSDGIEDEAYLSLLASELKAVFNQVNPGFVFYQAGVDVLATDKLGKFKLTQEGCRKRDELVFKACKSRKVPVEVSMGG